MAMGLKPDPQQITMADGAKLDGHPMATPEDAPCACAGRRAPHVPLLPFDGHSGLPVAQLELHSTLPLRSP